MRRKGFTLFIKLRLTNFNFWQGKNMNFVGVFKNAFYILQRLLNSIYDVPKIIISYSDSIFRAHLWRTHVLFEESTRKLCDLAFFPLFTNVKDRIEYRSNTINNLRIKRQQYSKVVCGKSFCHFSKMSLSQLHTRKLAIYSTAQHLLN